MSARVAICAFVILAGGCSNSGASSPSDGDSTLDASPGGGGDVGSGEHGDTEPATEGDVALEDSGNAVGDSGTGVADATAEMDAAPSTLSKCGAPLDAVGPTAASIVKNGPFVVASYTDGLPSSSAYKSLTVYYPSKGIGPFVTVMISPGLTEIRDYLQPWAQRFVSYGYVAVFVEANDTSNDSEATRATGLWAAIQTMKAENTRAGSPLAGKLSPCIVTSGHSLGGGASLTIANTHPTDVKAAIAFNPYDPSQSFAKVVAPTLVLSGQSDTTAPPTQHGRRQYDSMPGSIQKEYVEVAGGNHQSALFPGTAPGQYAIAWIKFAVDGDARYRPFLAKMATGLSDFATTLP